jgi:hypothetical protein
MEKRQRERLRRQKQLDKEQRRASRIAQRRTEREKGVKDDGAVEPEPVPDPAWGGIVEPS